jgi:hypothetical protein
MTRFVGGARRSGFLAQIPALAGHAFVRTHAENMDIGTIADRPRYATLRSGRPVGIRQRRFTGKILPGPSFWFYNRIYVLPSVVDFQAISKDVTRSVTLWNAYLSTTTILNVATPDDQTIAIKDLLKGAVLGTLQTLPFSVIVTSAGPGEVKTNLGITYRNEGGLGGSGPVVVLTPVPIRGVRAKFLPYAPQWANPYTVSYEHLTKTFTSRTGYEWREGLRQHPRKRIEYTIDAMAGPEGAEMRAVGELFLSWRGRNFVLPELTRFAVCPDGMPSGGTRVILDRTVPVWAAVGRVVVLSYGRRMVQRTIKSAAATTVEFFESDDFAWPAGSHICATISGFFEQKIDSQRRSSRQGVFAIKFRAAPGLNLEDDPGSPGLSYEGREVFVWAPNYASPPNVSYLLPADEIDVDVGVIERYFPVPFDERQIEATFTHYQQWQTTALVQFWLRQRGSQRSFWYPSFENDLPPIAGIQANDSRLRVADPDLKALYTGSLTHQVIRLIPLDGSAPIIRRVRAFDPASDEYGEGTSVQMTENWGRDLQASEIAMVEWMFQARFASDTLSVSYTTHCMSETTLTVRTLPVLPAEAA